MSDPASSVTGPRRSAPGAFAVSPDNAAEAYKRLSDLQDTVGQLVRQAEVLGRSVPLGGGYAGEIGDFMAQYGIGRHGSALSALTAFGRRLEELKQRIQRAIDHYKIADADAAAGVDCAGGG